MTAGQAGPISVVELLSAGRSRGRLAAADVLRRPAGVRASWTAGSWPTGTRPIPALRGVNVAVVRRCSLYTVPLPAIVSSA